MNDHPYLSVFILAAVVGLELCLQPSIKSLIFCHPEAVSVAYFGYL
jgi:hypothetical protein